MIGMCDKHEHDTVDKPDCLPSLFTIHKSVLHGSMEWIVKSPACQLKAKTMLEAIGPIFGVVPFKAQDYLSLQEYNYNIGVTQGITYAT